jgi:predicted transcriptional regulator
MESIHDYVLAELGKRNGSWPTVARESGVPYGTLKKIATKSTTAPRIDTLEQLAAYFREQGMRVQ